MTRSSGGSTEKAGTSKRPTVRKKESVSTQCGVCKIECKINERALTCDGCHVWHHTACVKIPEAVYEFYKDQSMAKLKFNWKCEACSKEPIVVADTMEAFVKETNKAIVAMQEEIKSLKKMMSEGSTQSPVWAKEEIGSLKKILEKEKTAGPASWSQVAALGAKDIKAMNKLATCVANKQKGIMDDRETRENNIIIKNMREADKESESDLNSNFESICAEIDFDKKPVNIERVGKIKSEKPTNVNSTPIKDGEIPQKPKFRPVKVCFSSNWEKRLFLSKLRNLKGKENFSGINICHDMGSEDREENRRLLKQAYNLNEENKKNGILDYKYKVRGPPWAMKMVKVNVEKN